MNEQDPLLSAAFDLLGRRGVNGTSVVELTNDVPSLLRRRIQERFAFVKDLVIIHDVRTIIAAGDEIASELNDARIRVSTLCCPDTDEKGPVCTDATVGAARHELSDRDFDAVLTIGSGTITDIGKLVASERGVPVFSVATAPSMNGYTSAISAIIEDGVKKTVPSVAPVMCFADPDVLMKAPRAMVGAGVGDAYSRFVAAADWRLSHALHQTPYDPELAELLGKAAERLRTLAKSFSHDRRQAIIDLSVVLYVTGIGQQAAIAGTQASGSEHLVSHYLDMIAAHPDFEHTADLHGRQVAVGTLFAARVYERIDRYLATMPASEPIRLGFGQPDPTNASLRTHFRGLAAAVLGGSRRLPNARDNEQTATCGSLRETVSKYAMNAWLSSEQIEADLCACEAPTTFRELGVSDSLKLDVARYSRFVRRRFTIFHLAGELGIDDEVLTSVASSM